MDQLHVFSWIVGWFVIHSEYSLDFACGIKALRCLWLSVDGYYWNKSSKTHDFRTKGIFLASR